MRLVLGPIPRSRVLSPGDEGWTPLREPTSRVFVMQVLLLSLPFLLPAFAILPELRGCLRTRPLAISAYVSFLALMIPVHEAIHASVYPGGLGSEHLVMGAWMRRGLCYVVYDSPVSRNRVLVMLSAPFIALSSLLVLVALSAPSEWRLVGILALLIHTAVCAGDFVTFARLVRQVPASSLVHNDGWVTYWKAPPQPMDS
ncbi:MAG: DUF3267 domain-containing protein [Lentisphaerae bacterium]|jgi:hypothetical protein|nr:DUF3267 domain-containing protein [Lentisphaerota bacterium]MBT5608556.1 DUF3267 domain-containing protein [Lentisphaerota bacterium]MBT7062097.1 DUF3267 domain-containing protein [Lentisphaerota bacterium]MBT7847735.1 DUF3267 domain-containing protein [Lentisphaerota bacterium]